MSYYLLYVISENTDNMHAMLKELSQAGFNGTIIPTASLRHAITCDTYIGQNFTLTKGGMFDVELHGYEGSF